MSSDTLSPKESLELISGVILEARQRFKEDGIIYVLWGVLITVAGVGQFTLNYYEQYQISYYPYFLMPVGGLVSYIYYKKKDSSRYNAISRIIGNLWLAVLFNTLILGFLFAGTLQASLTPLILILVGVGTIASGSALRDKMIFGAGILINLLGVASFFIDAYYHPLIIACSGFFLTFIPGVVLVMKK